MKTAYLQSRDTKAQRCDGVPFTCEFCKLRDLYGFRDLYDPGTSVLNTIALVAGVARTEPSAQRPAGTPAATST
jgi:hypothetical protein